MAEHMMEDLAEWAAKLVKPKNGKKEASEYSNGAQIVEPLPQLFNMDEAYRMLDVLSSMSRASEGDMGKFKEMVTGLYNQFVAKKKE